jgi:hypothetical protein
VKHRIAFINLPLLAVFLVLASSAALASNTWYVDGVHGKNQNDCESPQHACKTIGHAISLAHSGDSIMVAAATYTENLTISFSLRIVGSGAVTTIIDGGGNGTVVRISRSRAHVILSKLTIQNGVASNGGGIYNNGTLTVNYGAVSGNEAVSSGSFDYGGGIYNNGTMTVSNSSLSGNRSRVGGGGIYNNGGKVRISNSTLSGNAGFSGGGIQNNGGTLAINNSTLSKNVALTLFHLPGLGGGILSGGGMLRISNSTLSGNSAPRDGGGISASNTTTTLQNIIVANSTSGGNCYGTMTSNGYNLSSDGSCSFNSTGDLNNTDPKLGQLGNYGGPTQTIPLLAGSPAIDAGNPNGCTDSNGHLLMTDQRGFPRPDKEDSGGCDMGAYERQAD